MRVLLVGEDAGLEAELRARALDLVREDVGAEALLTLPPPVELRPLAQLEAEEWLTVFRAWAEEPFFAAQRWLRAALERGSVAWVAVTSILATQPFPGGGAVGAAALSLQTLVRITALEGGPRGVRANAVAPGWGSDALAPGLDPELAVSDTPGRRLATPGDVAGAVRWLLSPEAAHVTGEVLRVDGGYTITRGSRPDPLRA
jgi:3-oxoacyl-[acyl-carrier protein] reductase